jgi:signal transduction histidine kinase/ligand-binding sensor domain-containing protein
LKRIAFPLIACLLAVQVYAQNVSVQQMNRKVWSAADGAPSAVAAIEQTTDGTLWLGCASGLFRFDGIRFVKYPASAEAPLPSPNISTLAVSSDGSLWIGFRFGGVSRLHDGHLYNIVRDGLPNGTIKSLVWDKDGNLWAATRGGLARLQGNHWEKVAAKLIPTTYGAMMDRSGTLWVASEDRVFAKAAHEEEFREIAKRGGLAGGSPPFALSPQGFVWARTNSGFTRMDLNSGPDLKADPIFEIKGYSPLIFDRAGNLWSGADGAIHLLSVSEQKKDSESRRAQELSDAVTQSGVQSIFQDGEGDIWVGAGRGLTRIARSNVVPIALPPCVNWGHTLVARDANTLWVSCANPSFPRGITEIKDGVVAGQKDIPTFTAAYRDTDGSVWFGGPAGLGHVTSSGQIEMLSIPVEASNFELQAIIRDHSGGLWLSIIREGVFRLTEGKWRPYGDLAELPHLPAVVITAEPTGALWFGYTENRIARVDGSSVQLMGAKDGLNVGNVTAITIRDSHVWVSGDLGLARFDGKRFLPVSNTVGNAFGGVTGIIETQSGDLWLNGNSGISHIAAAEIEQAIRRSDYHVRAETFDYLDGVPGIAQQLRPIPSALETSDGRLWFATEGGVVFVDSNHISRNALAPPVTIWSLNANGVRYSAEASGLRLPVHTTDIRLDFTAGSLTLPERVNFRYKLDGFQQNWQEGGGRREAFYTNLSPGTYTFHVVASNNDGIWSSSGATLRFLILPAFYQTLWFYVLCAIAAAALLVVCYRMRMQYVSARVLSRLEDRLAERDRIARELHDTLLQGVQGLILRFQAATDIIPANEPAREVMERTLERADELLGESRARVRDLRDPTSGLVALADALAKEGEQLAGSHPVQFRVSTEGITRQVHPIVREEAALIGREALANAFRHAHATRIEAEVTYGDAELRLRIRDDGCGIDPTVLNSGGPPGHWGLLGMRERAVKIRGQLQIWSTHNGGTEIDLRVPASVAYSDAWRPVRRPWWRRAGPTLPEESQ